MLSYMLQSYKITSTAVLMLWLLPLAGLLAQSPSHWTLTDEDGLPSMTVYQILQDDLGYMWMGTENGICKYDGRSVTTFRDDQLKDNTIIFIRKDAWNRIWFVNLNGQIFYIANDQVFHFHQIPELQGMQVEDLRIDQNFLWLATKSLSKKQSNILSFDLYSAKQPFLSMNLKTLSGMYKCLVDQKQQFYFMKVTAQNVITYNKFDQKGKKLISEVLNIPDQNEENFKIHNQYVDRQYFSFSSYFGKKNEALYVFDRSKLIKNISMDKNFKINNVKFIDDQIWVLGQGNVWSLPKEGTVDKLSQENRKLHSINSNDIYKDREGNLWITTTGQGVLVIPSLPMEVFDKQNTSLPNVNTHTIYSDTSQNRIIAGIDEGKIVVFDPGKAPKVIQFPFLGRVTYITQDDQLNYYYLLDVGIVQMDKNLNFIRSSSYNSAKTVLKDNQARYWQGTSIACYLSNEAFDTTKRAILKKRTYALFEDYLKTIWIGTSTGLYSYQDTIQPFLENNIHQQYYITDITQSKDSTLWITTKTNGLLGIKDHRVIIHFTEQNGLASNQCKRLILDHYSLWVATNKGLTKIDLQTKKYKTINKNDGLPSNEINDITIVKDQVWVATPKGIARFPKDLDLHNARPPLVHISDLKIWEKPCPLSRNLQLKHRQNNLHLNFIGLGFKTKGAIRFKYKLSGVDQDWIYTSIPSARYPVLNPGKYTFEVYAINEDQVESLHAAIININIKEAWWQLLWVQSLFVFSILAGLTYFIHRRNQQAIAQRDIQDKINQLRQQALQTQMNPHFIFNALSAIQKSLTTNDQEQAMLYLSQFAKLIRSIFEYSKQNEISLEDEISFLKLYLNLEKLRFKSKIDIELNIDPALEPFIFETKIPPLLLQPLVENAFKHGLFHKDEHGLLKITFSKKDQYLRFTIEDNGVGRQYTKSLQKENWYQVEHQSSGFDIVRERLNIINKNQHPKALEIEDLYQGEQAVGTKVSTYILCENFK